MCGIFGLATSEKGFDATVRKDTFLNGLMFNMPRGMDSTGAAGFWTETQDKKDYVASRISKRALHMIDWLGTTNAELFLDKFSDYYYVIGHVRATTKGATSDKNAHPFNYGDYTLVHNGTVYNRGELTKAREFVDSADICATMEERGEEKTLEGLEGGFALVWHNASDNTLNFARNNRKPLAFAYIKKRNEMYFSSEWSVLWSVLVRNGLKAEGQIQITKPHHHYKFFKEDLRKYEDVEFKPYSRPQQTHRSTAGAVGPTLYLPDPAKSSTQADAHTVKSEENSPKNSSTDTQTDGQGTTTLIKRHKYVNDMLEPLKLSVGCLVVMQVTAWKEYPHSRGMRGQLTGYRLARPDQEFTIPEIHIQQWKRWQTKCIGVRVENYKEIDGKHTVWCSVDHSWTNGLLNGIKKPVEPTPESSKSTDKKGEVYWDPDIRRYKQRRDTAGGAVIFSVLSPKDAADALGQTLDEVERRQKLPPIERSYWGSGGRRISKEEWDRYTSDGCGECSSSIDTPDVSADGRQLVWYEDSPLCLGCSMKHEIEQRLGLKDKVH